MLRSLPDPKSAAEPLLTAWARHKGVKSLADVSRKVGEDWAPVFTKVLCGVLDEDVAQYRELSYGGDAFSYAVAK